MQLYPLFPLLYPILKSSFPKCLWRGNPNTKIIALTFDDGPHPQYTQQLLQVLDYYQIQASFFWLGVCVERFPHIAQQVHSRGHWIGLHGYYHHNFPFLSPIELKQSLEKTQAAIYNACNLPPEQVRDIRPPNGLFLPHTLQLFHQWNYRPVMWSIVPEDWVSPGITKVVNRVINTLENGSLIVLHDGVYGGQNVAEIAQIIIPQLLKEGYSFVTIDTLWQEKIKSEVRV